MTEEEAGSVTGRGDGGRGRVRGGEGTGGGRRKGSVKEG